MLFTDEGKHGYTVCGVEHVLDTFRWFDVAVEVEKQATIEPKPGETVRSVDPSKLGRLMAEVIIGGFPDSKTGGMLVEPLKWPPECGETVSVSDHAGYALFVQIVAEFDRIKKKADRFADSFTSAESAS